MGRWLKCLFRKHKPAHQTGSITTNLGQNIGLNWATFSITKYGVMCEGELIMSTTSRDEAMRFRDLLNNSIQRKYFAEPPDGE